MAFSDAEKTKIRSYLGFPLVFFYVDTRLESAMEVVGEHEASAAHVREILDRIDEIIERVSGSGGALSTAGIKQVDEVHFFGEVGQTASDQSRNEGKRQCGQLSIAFGVPLQGDFFGGGGYKGDGFMSNQFQGSGGRRIPLG